MLITLLFFYRRFLLYMHQIENHSANKSNKFYGNSMMKVPMNRNFFISDYAFFTEGINMLREVSFGAKKRWKE